MVSRSKATTVHGSAPGYEGWLSFSDFFTLGKLLFCAFAATTPERYWPAVSTVLARTHLKLKGSKRDRIARTCEEYLHIDPDDLEQDVIAAEYKENIETIRENFPGGWQNAARIEGVDEIESALHRGRGVVLWVSAFAHSDVVTKKALSGAGYALTHLSAIGHPFSPTRFGARILNPIRLRAENRYLARRVIVAYGRAQPALDLLRDALRGNGIVTITAIGAGKSVCTAPLLGGTMRLATGAPRLALETGSALLPVYTVPDESQGYRVICGPDLLAGVNRGDKGAVEKATYLYVEHLQSFVIAQPCIWKGWFSQSWRPEAPC